MFLRRFGGIATSIGAKKERLIGCGSRRNDLIRNLLKLKNGERSNIHMAYGEKDGSGKGVGRKGGLRRNKNKGVCSRGGAGSGEGGGRGKGQGRRD